MSTDWTPLELLAELTFVVLFAQALVAYLRRRDPLQRDVMLVFAPGTVLVGVDIARRSTDGGLPTWVNAVSVTVLLAQPYLTVRLASRLRSVPSWLQRGVLLVLAALAGWLAFEPRPLPPIESFIMVTTFLVTELVAAALLFGKARRRTGANRARLMMAAGATAAFGLMIMAIGLASRAGADPMFNAAFRILALISGLGYLVAFAPPRWLRRMFAASAAQSVTERLLRAPAESADQVWQIYADIMREQTGTDAVSVLMPRSDGQLVPAAYAGPPVPTPDELGFADVTALIRAGQPARLRDSDEAALVAHYGDDLRDDFVTVLSMPVPPDAEGAVLLFNRHRSLFSDDDLRLLAALGGQAGILAERQAVATAHLQLAAELKISVEALTRASQAKSSFMANMSHELRTPLNAIIGFSDLMRLEEPDGDRRRVPAEWADHIHTSGRHLLGLINDILDLAKVEAGRLDLRLAPLRVDTSVQELLTGLSPLLTSKNLTAETKLPEATVLADRVRFRQIVENLLSNAIKFTEPGGTITISGKVEGEVVAITVSDTGVGIAAADHDKVFEEFQQVGDPDRQRAGTGLGLALTRRLVEAHDGEITLQSAPGQGSAFTVRLPAATVVNFEEGPDSGARVLLVEDDPQSAELLTTQLVSAGYHVDVAGTGEAGLTAAGARPPDAIVLDVALPGIDGFEVIRRLKADARLAGIPVFFATIIDERQAGLALGANDYFVKPVDQAALLGALAKSIAARPTPRVLVVDHDDDIRRAIEDGLRAGGADVVACADGRDGLALSRESHFDLIVCDMQSPEVDGFSMLAAMEQDPATRHTPVLGLTAAGGVEREPGGAGPLVATAMVGGTGWEALAPLLGGSVTGGSGTGETNNEENP
jgi:signal transduction histidine kinase/CheY-like chemotaxis protein